jgi:hypothetical protein
MHGSRSSWLEKVRTASRDGSVSDICKYEKVTRDDASSQRHSTAAAPRAGDGDDPSCHRDVDVSPRAGVALRARPAPGVDCPSSPRHAVTPPSLPRRLARFICEDVHSVLQLEIVLLLRERGGDWSVPTIADELRVTVYAVESHLRDLLGRGLLRPGAEADCFLYAPRDASVRSRVDELAGYYATMQHSVINLIFPGDGDAARDDEARVRGTEE